MSLSQNYIITGKYDFHLDEKLRVQIPSEVRSMYERLIQYEILKDNRFKINIRKELLKKLGEEHRRGLYVSRDKDIIKVYFPFLSEKIKKHIRMNESSSERINFFRKMHIKNMDSQYRINLRNIILEEELNDFSKKTENEGSFPITLYGNVDYLLINLDEMKKVT